MTQTEAASGKITTKFLGLHYHFARSKRTARRALVAASVPVPDSLKPGKAVKDLPEPEKADKALQKRLKELRFST